LSNFTGGVYLVWNFTGHVIIRVTNTNISSNAVVSGLFFGPGGATSAPIKTNTTATANWKGANGADGFSVANKPLTLSCSPRILGAGATASCELRMPVSPVPLRFQVTANSAQVRPPAAVVSRSNQSSLTFQVSSEATAKSDQAVVTASLGDSQAQDKITVISADRPVLINPGTRTGRIGERLEFLATGVDPNDLPLQLAASSVPPGASFDPASGRFEWTPSAAQTGTHRFVYSATNSARQSSTAQLTIEVDSGKPALTPSERFMCSPSSVATLAGKWLAAPATILSDLSGSSMDLGGTKVTVNGRYVPVLFISETAVKFLCPNLEAGTPLSVVVETASASTDPLTTTMQEASPVILSLNDSGEGQGLISFVGEMEIVMARNFRGPGHPAQSGDPVVIWATGLGPAVENSRVLTVKLGGVPAVVDSIQAVAGLAGVYAIQVHVPAATPVGDTVPIQLEVTASSRAFESPSVTLAVEAIRQ
jgi:uncharacterized protein (TIGR03437 family)